ncbi:lipoate--protein ligase family protein [Candidatus Oscillochloris fontis]|uniref:lipoate--protein ligase family protein n=1 Tax=Candidatus Oscillochloris fontis TaxID=2496868 RepID=UPI00101DD2E0|nr:ligase [Candidatus Oscillochloris fontis]
MQTWRFLPQSDGDAQHELASAEAMLVGLSEIGQPVLRWYHAPTPALVIGSGQALHEINRATCAAAGVRLHRRASGGSAVLFGPDLLMQDIALPAGHHLAISDVSESYRWLGEAWLATLAQLGVAASMVSIAEAREDRQTLPLLLRRVCFAGRSPYEILSGGRKLVGFSQVRRRQGMLLQVGVYMRWSGAALAQLLELSAVEAQALVSEMQERVVGLDEIVPQRPTPATIMDAFAVSLREQHQISLDPQGWHPAEKVGLQAALVRYAPIND